MPGHTLSGPSYAPLYFSQRDEMKNKLGILAAFGIINLALAAPSLAAGWKDDMCIDKLKPDNPVVACCPSCSWFCGCSL
jgi:hypothetical protein